MAPTSAKRSDPSASSKGAASKRRRGLRTDKDGDLVMDAGPRDVNRIGKSRAKGAKAGKANSSASTRNSLNSATAEREFLRHVASGEGSARPRNAARTADRGLQELRVTGWAKSTAASSEDRGISSLITFLEKRATIGMKKKPPLPGGKARDPAKVKKSRVEEDTLFISVPADQVALFLRIDGWVFAGTNLKVARASAPDQEDTSDTAKEIKEKFKNFLSRRYNPELKLLDLNSMGTDAELNSLGLFNTTSTQSKFFPALMKVCDSLFKSAQEKREFVESVTLSSNELPSVAPVTQLSQTFPDLKNLDLSNNKLENLDSLSNWRHKFRHLDHLILSGNPLEQNCPDYHLEIAKWYRTLRLLNGIQIRSDEEAANPALGVKSGPSAAPPVFIDDGGIAADFIRNFFAGFDSDRGALADLYYDATSTFSLSVNNGALRDPSQTDKKQPQDWDVYIKRSRNLRKVTHQPARMARKFKGTEQIQEVFSLLPASRHPNLADLEKWCIECVPQPGVPDPTGQIPGGVGGLLITIHGEFEDMDISTGQPKMLRSFDRTFILGPGGKSGVRVVNDMWTIRPYGGNAAWKPEQPVGCVQQAGPVVPQDIQQPVQPTITPVQPVPALTQEQMVAEVSRLTGMKPEFSRQCLESGGWDMEKAGIVFQQAKDQLPPEAFL